MSDMKPEMQIYKIQNPINVDISPIFGNPWHICHEEIVGEYEHKKLWLTVLHTEYLQQIRMDPAGMAYRYPFNSEYHMLNSFPLTAPEQAVLGYLKPAFEFAIGIRDETDGDVLSQFQIDVNLTRVQSSGIGIQVSFVLTPLKNIRTIGQDAVWYGPLRFSEQFKLGGVVLSQADLERAFPLDRRDMIVKYLCQNPHLFWGEFPASLAEPSEATAFPTPSLLYCVDLQYLVSIRRMYVDMQHALDLKLYGTEGTMVVGRRVCDLQGFPIPFKEPLLRHWRNRRVMEQDQRRELIETLREMIDLRFAVIVLHCVAYERTWDTTRDQVGNLHYECDPRFRGVGDVRDESHEFPVWGCVLLLAELLRIEEGTSVPEVWPVLAPTAGSAAQRVLAPPDLADEGLFPSLAAAVAPEPRRSRRG